MACEKSCDCKKCSFVAKKKKETLVPINVISSSVRKSTKEFAKSHVKKAAPMDSTSQKLADKIRIHNQKKLHGFVGKHKEKVKKSIDFHQTTSAIDTGDQMLAESTGNPTLIKYIKDALQNDISKIFFSKGTLVLSQKEPGLYNGFFQDNAGQVVEKFDNQTVEIVAKNMQLKSLYDAPVEAVNVAPAIASPTSTPHHDYVEEMEDRIIAREEAQKVVGEVLAHMKQPTPKYVRVRFGDMEVELRKSIRDFVNDFKKAQEADKDIVSKAISSWRKKASAYTHLPNDQAAAKELLSNWEQHQEGFCQLVYALQQLGKDDE